MCIVQARRLRGVSLDDLIRRTSLLTVRSQPVLSAGLANHCVWPHGRGQTDCLRWVACDSDWRLLCMVYCSVLSNPRRCLRGDRLDRSNSVPTVTRSAARSPAISSPAVRLNILALAPCCAPPPRRMVGAHSSEAALPCASPEAPTAPARPDACLQEGRTDIRQLVYFWSALFRVHEGALCSRLGRCVLRQQASCTFESNRASHAARAERAPRAAHLAGVLSFRSWQLLGLFLTPLTCARARGWLPRTQVPRNDVHPGAAASVRAALHVLAHAAQRRESSYILQTNLRVV
jgi:hypothetical protein